MDNHGQWKWINKAAQKFIRYDLPINSNLAIVTFSNNSKVEHSMIQVHSDQVCNTKDYNKYQGPKIVAPFHLLFALKSLDDFKIWKLTSKCI